MSKNKVISFEQKSKKKKGKSKTNIFSEMIESLRYNIDLLGFLGEDAENRLQKYASLVEKDSKDFLLDPEEMTDFWEALLYEEAADLNFVTESINKESYHLQIHYDVENEFVAVSFSKWVNEIPDSVYNEKKGRWESCKKSELPERFTKILDSKSPESDILELLLDYQDLTVKDYDKIKSKYHKLFSLYNKTNRYMEPTFMTGNNREINLYLEPKDVFRHGFCVGMEKDELVLMQNFHIDDLVFLLDDEFYMDDDECDYNKIVGTTDNVDVMQKVVFHLASRYTNDDIFTIPVSLDQYVEVDDVESLMKYNDRKDTKLNDIEKKNLNSFCSFVKNHISFEEEY